MAADGNLVQWIQNVEGSDKQLKHFVADTSGGVTQVGLSRIKQSIAFRVHWSAPSNYVFVTSQLLVSGHHHQAVELVDVFLEFDEEISILCGSKA